MYLVRLCLSVMLLYFVVNTCSAQDWKTIRRHYDDLTYNVHYTTQQKLDSVAAGYPRPLVLEYANYLLAKMGGTMELSMLRQVLDLGANPNGTTKYDAPIFHFPFSPGSTVRFGNNTGKCGSVRHADCPDSTFRRQIAYVEMLIKYGAKWDTVIGGQNNVMLAAAQTNELRLFRYLVDKNGGKLIGPAYTYLDEPVHMGNIDVVKYLVEDRKLDVNTMLPGNNSALSRCDATVDMEAYLLQKGIQVNIANGGGWTPLMLTIEAGCIPSIELLMNAGADRTAKTHKGEDIVDIAKHYSYDESIVKYVKTHRKA